MVTKFNPKQLVFVIYNNEITKLAISTITITENFERYTFRYPTHGIEGRLVDNLQLSKHKIFETKNDLIKSL